MWIEELVKPSLLVLPSSQVCLICHRSLLGLKLRKVQQFEYTYVLHQIKPLPQSIKEGRNECTIFCFFSYNYTVHLVHTCIKALIAVTCSPMSWSLYLLRRVHRFCSFATHRSCLACTRSQTDRQTDRQTKRSAFCVPIRVQVHWFCFVIKRSPIWISVMLHARAEGKIERSTRQFFFSPPVVLLLFISRFALVR